VGILKEGVMSGSDIHPIAVEVDAKTHERLEQLAKSRGLTHEEIIKEVLEWFLELGESDDRAAIAAWNHYKETGLHVTNEEVGAWLAELEAGNDDAEPPACHV
jgi:predicted transcriptional regulator